MKHLILSTALALGLGTFARAEPGPPAAPLLLLGIDGTASLGAPSPLDPRFTQQQVLFDTVPGILQAARPGKGSLQLLVICHQPLFVLESGVVRSSVAEVVKNVGLAGKDCTRPGTRIDLALLAMAELAGLGKGPYGVVLLTDGVNETAAGLALEEGHKALAALAARPPKVFALLGVREDLRLGWELAARRTLGAKGTAVVVSSPRDLASGLKRLKAALEQLR